jgi:hypothetical protein
MGETVPPETKSQPARRDGPEDPHESVTIAPPASNLEERLRQPTPLPLSPALSQHSDLHFRAAVEAGNRAGASLSELSKMAAELSGGVIGVKRANEQLLLELSTLQAMLGSANEQQLGLERRVAELEQELLALREQAERERQFLIAQQDDFLAALVEEHEEALTAARPSPSDTQRLGPDASELAQKLAKAEAARLELAAECLRARETLARAQIQRDEAQARAAARERERDELRAEASMLRARLGMTRSPSTLPPPTVAPRPPSFRPPPALELDAGELDSALHPRPPAPRLAMPTPAYGSASALPRISTQPGLGRPKASEPAPPADFGPPSADGTPPPPARAPITPPPEPRVMSAANLPPSQLPLQPVLKQKPHPTSRPLISYSLGEDRVRSEMLEGARISSKPPKT